MYSDPKMSLPLIQSNVSGDQKKEHRL